MKYLAIIGRARRQVVEAAGMVDPHAWAFAFGANDIHPRYLMCWVCCATDDQKARLGSGGGLLEVWRGALRKNGYPPEVIEELELKIESQQTVDRDFQGNWRYRIQ